MNGLFRKDIISRMVWYHNGGNAGSEKYVLLSFNNVLYGC